MSKDDEDGLKTLQITNPKLYGYFDKDGEHIASKVRKTESKSYTKS